MCAGLDEAFDQKSWHGTNLRGSIRGLTAAQADWRIAPGKHSIAEIVLHCAYWKYAAWRRLSGQKRGSFPLKGSNWFPRPGPLSDAEWKAAVQLLMDQHVQLRAAATTVSAGQLGRKLPRSKVSYGMLLRGVALHDVYHAGQIQQIKGLHKRGGG